MAGTLKDQAVKGVVWNLSERFGVQIMNFALGILLARILVPEDYGLLGMILIFFFIADAIIQGGLGEAYVQKKEVSDIDANTVFYTNLAISLILFIVLWICAPMISRFFGHPILIDLTRVMGLVFIINSFNIIQQAQIRRNLDFKRKAGIALLGTLISSLVAIYMAIKGLGVWSLLIQRLTNRLIMAIGLWITTKWKPTLHFSRQSFNELFIFGSWILASSVIGTLFENIYLLVIGKLFPASDLGYYTKAKAFQQLGSQQVSQAVSTVSMPVFSKMQDEPARLRNAMGTFNRNTTLFVMPIMIGLLVLAKPFVLIFLTAKWEAIIPFLQLVAIIGFFYPLHSINVQVLLAQGKSKLNFRVSMAKNILRVISLLITYRWGVLYIILGEVMISALSLTLNTYYSRKLLDYGLWAQFRDIRHVVLGTLVAALVTWLSFRNTENLWFFLLGGSFLFLFLYLSYQFMMNRNFFKELKHMISAKGM